MTTNGGLMTQQRRTIESPINEIKPKLRGWIHAGMAPLVVAASIVLIALAPTTSGRASAIVFGVSAVLLFGTSAVYHRGRWSPRVTAALRRLDHTNIFPVSYTHLRAHETRHDLVCRLLLEKK